MPLICHICNGMILGGRCDCDRKREAFQAQLKKVIPDVNSAEVDGLLKIHRDVANMNKEKKMTLIERLEHFEKTQLESGDEYGAEVLYNARMRLVSAQKIMEKFVNKVDTGRARSKETYAEMKEWLEDE